MYTQFKTVGTVRANPCNKTSAITHLAITAGEGATAYELGPYLKSLADANQLVVDLPGPWPRTVRVQVFQNKWGQWIARTDADSTLVNNLDSLPVYFMPGAGSTHYKECPI